MYILIRLAFIATTTAGPLNSCGCCDKRCWRYLRWNTYFRYFYYLLLFDPNNVLAYVLYHR